MKRTIIQSIIAFILLFTVTFAVCIYDYNREKVETAVENEVVIEKLKYNEIEDLLDATTSFRIQGYEFVHEFQRINNIVYTIKEDDLIDEWYEMLYNSSIDTHESDEFLYGWLIYYLAENNNYCNTTRTNTRSPGDKYCEVGANYVSVSYNDDLRVIEIEDTYTKKDLAFDTAATTQIIEGLNYAYVISQGEKTEGYDEAVQWFYDKAEENKEYVTREYDDYFTPGLIFKYDYEDLKPVHGKTWEWIVLNSDKHGRHRYVIIDIQHYAGL